MIKAPLIPLFVGLLSSWLLAQTITAQDAETTTFAPAAPLDDCGLKVALDYVGQVESGNLASPVAIGRDLFLINQEFGILYVDRRGNGGFPLEFFRVDQDGPPELEFNYVDEYPTRIVGISPGPSDDEMYVSFASSVLPDNVATVGYWPSLLERHSTSFNGTIPGSPVVDLYSIGNLDWMVSEDYPLPENETEADYCCLVNPIYYDPSPTLYHVIYKYSFKRNRLHTKGLVDPVPLVAFRTQAGPCHTGGAMTTTRDGSLLYATGDGLPFGTNGRDAAQDDASQLSKIFEIDAYGNVTLLAKGVRNVQHMELVDGTDGELLIFSDIGGVTAEEVNVIRLDDLRDASVIENFGWGRNPADGLGREGTFLVDSGVAGIWKTQPPAVGKADEKDKGYIQPHAQFGRVGGDFVAVSGPVTSVKSFSTIKALFGNLAGGELLATVGDLNRVGDKNFYQTVEDICRVQVVDNSTGTEEVYETMNHFGAAVDGINATETDPASYRRDARFFRFPDGNAGVLFERSGVYYRLSQLS